MYFFLEFCFIKSVDLRILLHFSIDPGISWLLKSGRLFVSFLVHMPNLISFTEKGLYCERGGFYIDPWKPVDKAIITHGHGDHAYFGHKYYLCHTFTKPILQLRLGENNYQTLEWGEAHKSGGSESIVVIPRAIS